MNNIQLIFTFFSVVWFILGLFECKTSIDHAKRYKYKPILFAAWYWFGASFFGSLVALIAS